MTGSINVDFDSLEAIGSRLDLRTPNKEAVDNLATAISQHFDVEGRPSPFECVVDSATGVGKTFILVGAIEYFAAQGVRNFAVITPGKTIRNKTIGHFTAGHRKCLLGNMESQPFLVTADNFDSPATRVIIEDDSRVKIYVFSVQALTAPTSKQGKRTHKFQEGLGDGFYQHLAGLDDLMVFADEHHCYWGDSWSGAIADLDPYAVVGLTATPDPRTPDDQIIYRYPLAAAIADRYVKTPVIVGRRDDRNDSVTKLSDGVTLLRYKANAVAAYAAENDLTPVNPVMLVVAQNVDEADEYGAILRSDEFEGGAYKDAILVVHSRLTGDKKEQALAELEAVEDPDSPIRVIISVGMLKEGWDVKNVYVIAAMRALASKVLTEQTLGRGLRLPFGQYTDVEMLDTLEVLAHEKYDALLRSANVLNEQFIDKRTRAVLKENAQGQTVAVVETTTVSTPVILDPTDGTATTNGTDVVAEQANQTGGVAVSSLDTREAAAKQQSSSQQPVEVIYEPRPGMPDIKVPRLLMTSVQTPFSLADITDLDPFRRLGRQIAANPEAELRRMRVSARVVSGPDGLRRTELVTTTAADRLTASASLLPLLDARKALIDALLAAPIVPKRANQAMPADTIVGAFIDGIGSGNAESVLSAYGDRAAARLVALVTAEHRKFVSKPVYEEVVELKALGGKRASRRVVLLERTGRFVKSLAYDSFSRSMYDADWFDSEPERKVANIVDDSNDVACWVRLHIGEMPILWRSDGRLYNPDLIIVENSGDHWVVEIKADDTANSPEVQGKRQAALRWVNYVNADPQVAPTKWHYLLVTETDIEQSAGSWVALKQLEA